MRRWAAAGWLALALGIGPGPAAAVAAAEPASRGEAPGAPPGAAEPGPAAAAAFRLPVEEVTLANGVRLLLAPRPGAAMLGAAWAVRRGSGDEPPRQAGLAHLVEHLLHQGSAAVTASDYARLYTEAGAVGIDARTDRDLTAYFLRLPASQLELWFWLESDRLLRPALGGLDRERAVIAEERRQRLESLPTGAIEEELEALLWGEHPYAWPPGGRPDALARLSPADVERFFAGAYGAGNLTVALAGDFDPEQARQLAERYFGRLPGRREPGVAADAATPPEGPAQPAAADGAGGAPAGTPAPPVAGERIVGRTCACPTQARILYPTVAAGHPDRAALDVLAGLLAGRGGRLHRHLVLGRGVAFAAGARHEAGRQGGQLAVELEAGGGAPATALVEAWDAELARLEAQPPEEAELERVRNQVTTDAWRGLREPLDLALRLLVADAQGGGGSGGWRTLETWPGEVLAVGAEDVLRVAGEYLQRGRRVVGLVTREEAR